MGYKLMAGSECYGRADTREAIERILEMRTRRGRDNKPIKVGGNQPASADSKLTYTIVED